MPFSQRSVSTGPAYWNTWIYRGLMRGLYGPAYHNLYANVAELIEPGLHVVDLCCGDAAIASILIAKGCQYTGLDINPAFLRFGRGSGLELRSWDGRRDPLPEADVVLIQSSLYQFIPGEKALLEKMLRAARKKVIISEPIQNLASSRNVLLKKMALWMVHVDGQDFESRFTEESLRALCLQMNGVTFRSEVNGRQMLCVLEK